MKSAKQDTPEGAEDEPDSNSWAELNRNTGKANYFNVCEVSETDGVVEGLMRL
jgi:hypothetical protein